MILIIPFGSIFSDFYSNLNAIFACVTWKKHRGENNPVLKSVRVSKPVCLNMSEDLAEDKTYYFTNYKR